MRGQKRRGRGLGARQTESEYGAEQRRAEKRRGEERTEEERMGVRERRADDSTSQRVSTAATLHVQRPSSEAG